MSTFSGKIKEYPQISIDRFDGRNLASTAYFLSHAHSDHMMGLSSPQYLDHLESNCGVYLYCSYITARFLEASIRHRPLSLYVRPLQLEESVKITVPNVVEEAYHNLWVTLIPAAHCPGSVMFFFEGRGGSVLYTGDFRISVGDAERLRPLHNEEGTVKTIDSLHIDTTFCHRDIMHFPSREESSLAVAELIEEWLAKGNNFLIHLVCAAKYGYEFLYKSLHEQFGMKIHVSRWKYHMYDTVPEIQDVLTLNATETWIHACDFRSHEVCEDPEAKDRHLPCRCVPYGVDTAPNIRVIKTSALYFTQYQSSKDIKLLNHNGTFCRVLLSMHASCSEVLDLVSYLRPRKVLPNVIPLNSTKEEVLNRLHEALNRSGDHYSIEYGGSQRSGLGSFKRQLHSTESSCNGSMVEAGMLDVFRSSPNKRRRHSDSNMTLILPTPRGNMKGSLSLEGEGRQHDPNAAEGEETSATPCQITDAESPSDSLGITPPKLNEDLVWKDPYTPSPSKSRPVALSSFKYNQIHSSSNFSSQQTIGAKNNLSLKLDSLDKDSSSDSPTRHGILKSATSPDNRKRFSSSSPKVSIDMDEVDSSYSLMSGLKTEGSRDSIDLSSVFSDDGDRDSCFDFIESSSNSSRPASSTGVAGESSIKRSRKMWYKHKYFSTPVHEDVEKNLKVESKPLLGPRSCSLPLPEVNRERILSPDLFSMDRNLPLITVSSPSDQASESQISDETNLSAVLSSGETSNTDVSFIEKIVAPLPPEGIKAVLSSDLRTGLSGSTRSSHRPSVICAPPSKFDIQAKEDRSDVYSNNILNDVNSNKAPGWIDCNKAKLKNRTNFNICRKNVGSVTNSRKINTTEEIVIGSNGSANKNPALVDLVSVSDYTQDLDDLLDGGGTAPTAASTRSSCLKTAKRTHDQVEVVSLDSPL